MFTIRKFTAILLTALLCVPFFAAPAYAASPYAITIDGNAGNAVTIPASGTIGAVVTTGQGSVNKDMPAADHVAKANAGSGDLLASVNGALFNSYYNAGKTLAYPDNCAQIMGLLMSGGEVISRGSGKNVLLGVTDTGKYLIDRVSVDTAVWFRGTEKFTFWAVNTYHNDPSAIDLFTSEMGYGFALQSGAVAVRIRGGMVTEIQKGLSRLEIPAAGEKVAVFNSNAWADACTWNSQPQTGNTARIETVFTPEKAGTQEDWDRVVTAVGCSPWLLEGGVDKFAENTNSDPKMGRDYKAQRTFAAILPDGSLMIGECTATFGQIIDYLKSIGAVDAMALDGGASSTLYTPSAGYVQPAGRKLASMLHFVDYGSAEAIPGKGEDPFTEEPSAWAASYVQKAKDTGLIPEGFNLMPRANITRAEFASLAVSLVKQYYAGSDYDEILMRNGIDYNAARAALTDTYLMDVMQAYQLGIVAGDGKGHFNPNGSITRREAAVMLSNAAKLVGREAEGESLAYEDAADIDWAADFVDFVTRAGIMGSTSKERALFSPLGYYTQEQALTTLCNLLPYE
ncbi:MAG: S-layer homology domain-containing protein [Firmicutes bacterium]|nr:S-layer homology domain-containing protein [Bacillota bacterium]